MVIINSVLQLLTSANEGEGMVWWIIIVTVLATIALAIIKSVFSKIVLFFSVKKEESEERTKETIRKTSIIAFVGIVGVILIFFQDSLGLFLHRPAGEVAFAGLMIILFTFLVTGLIFRNATHKIFGKVKR